MRAGFARLRRICLGLPEASERETFGAPTFRVREKIFAMSRERDGPALWCKAPPGAQAILVGADPARFFAPPYVGPKGWIGVWLKGADWDEVALLVRRSYRLVAPRRLAALVQEPAAPAALAEEPGPTPGLRPARGRILMGARARRVRDRDGDQGG